ncbi:MAG: hypothetical protein LLF96_05090 [Eubacteriales bacterium]|nr:hypothetical protein [Eubacteriales bacterium]
MAETIDSIFLPAISRGGYGDAYFFNISLHFSYYIYAAPLACAFASSGLFCDDAETGYYRLRMMKAGRRGYQLGMWFGSTIGGGLALFTSVALFAFTCRIILQPHFMPSNIAAVDGWRPVLAGPFGNWMYMLLNALLAFLFGMIWSGVGLMFSILSPNRYVSYFAPFIVCFCSQLALPPYLQPNEMLVQMNWASFSFAKLAVYQTVLYVAAMIVFIRLMDRRLMDG